MTIKKTVLPVSTLPPLSKDGEYILRYRIVSEDKNRTSHWSPIYYIDAKPFIVEVSGDLQVSSNSLGVTAIWGDTNLKPLYDVFVSFGTYDDLTSTISWEDYFYHGSSPIHTYSFLRGVQHTDVRVKVQLSGIEKEVNDILTVCTIEASIR
jgi:hypothetical protein